MRELFNITSKKPSKMIIKQIMKLKVLYVKNSYAEILGSKME